MPSHSHAERKGEAGQPEPYGSRRTVTLEGGARGRWRVVENGDSRGVFGATFLDESAARSYARKNSDASHRLEAEFDPVVAWGDGKKSPYGPTFASEVNDDIWGDR